MRHLFSALLRPLPLLTALVSGSLLGGGLAMPLPAEALGEEAIVDKLEQVPVFVILNSDGQPLTAAAEVDDQEVKVPVVFIDGEAAEEFLTRAREEDPSAEVALVDLGTLYQETVLGDEAQVPLLYLPIGDELDTAIALQSNFQGVPLFIARQGADGPYLTINQDGQASLPMFFSRNDLQTLLDRYGESNAEAADDIVVQVLSLEWLLATMTSNSDPELDAQLQQVRLFPSTEVLDFIRAQDAEPAAE
ncbi:Tic22 family protein [Leptolyngbya sp. CCNP1308]|uniref:Tic22 family protein n=1 Tax=Leptolyngbya sp. CCNP1308 TaxID=3110255 RepID=UPI002B1F19D3|nr:Tic22 family protein [Leptolyngbya sp. CCNP1308]MEA5450545.1 Tic22 family protein [Leptolyngbya sp. CCNP1308]